MENLQVLGTFAASMSSPTSGSSLRSGKQIFTPRRVLSDRGQSPIIQVADINIEEPRQEERVGIMAAPHVKLPTFAGRPGEKCDTIIRRDFGLELRQKAESTNGTLIHDLTRTSTVSQFMRWSRRSIMILL